MSLTDLRKKKNLTLDEVAEQLGCSKQAYWNYEKGIRKIPLDKAVRLSKIYKVKVEDIFFYSTSNQNVNDKLSV
jgi:transcriptional regulator with XRE-family HTH domain